MRATGTATKQRGMKYRLDKNKTAVTAATVRRLGAHTGTHKSSDYSIASGRRKSNENFLTALCVSAIELYNNIGGMN